MDVAVAGNDKEARAPDIRPEDDPCGYASGSNVPSIIALLIVIAASCFIGVIVERRTSLSSYFEESATALANNLSSLWLPHVTTVKREPCASGCRTMRRPVALQTRSGRPRYFATLRGAADFECADVELLVEVWRDDQAESIASFTAVDSVGSPLMLSVKAVTVTAEDLDFDGSADLVLEWGVDRLRRSRSVWLFDPAANDGLGAFAFNSTISSAFGEFTDFTIRPAVNEVDVVNYVNDTDNSIGFDDGFAAKRTMTYVLAIYESDCSAGPVYDLKRELLVHRIPRAANGFPAG